ncbi:MAG: 4Fe-4S dicluster domain-containing protein [Dehalococcoidia bacterium]|nr:MAG: 4Fe-4S dicluster domain-containing protein [Dehalococcoidia bacterium]
MKLWRTPFDQAEKAAKPPKVLIDKERCKGCGYCVEFCPRAALEMSEELSPKGYTLAVVADESKCLGCGLCDVLCPEFAIHLESSDNDN